MKPDEHKKKKNAAYKKKHGIAGKSSNETSEKEKRNVNLVKKSLDKQKLEKRNDPTWRQGKDKPTDSNQGFPSSDESSSDEIPHVAPKRKQFKRREIISNWQKYELNAEKEDKISSRGEDYHTLLNMTGEAMSRFRFRDELEWEDEYCKGEPPAEKEKRQNYLQLNTLDLTQSLACIPVHHILGIDENLFLKDQMSSILETAAKNRALYCDKEPIFSDILQSDSSTLLLENPEILKSEVKECHEDSKQHINETNEKPNVVDSCNVIQCFSDTEKSSDSLHLPGSTDLKENKDNENHVDETQSAIEANCVLTSNKEICGIQDDDLDRLLDMDFESQKKDGEDAGPSISSSSTSCTKDSSSKNDHDEHVTNTDENKESENLEEWLDSILD